MLRRGDYVLCRFPFRGSSGPAPSAHIVLCAATGREGDAAFAIVFYTTSQTDYPGARRPRQYLLVNEARALEVGQKTAFHVDASRIARLPLTIDYFPELRQNSLRVIAHDPHFVTLVEERLKELIEAGIEVTRVDALTRK